MHFDFISFSFAVAAQQINHHTTQTFFFFFLFPTACFVFASHHQSRRYFFFSCCPLIESSSQLYVTKAFMSANAVNKNRTLTARVHTESRNEGLSVWRGDERGSIKKSSGGRKSANFESWLVVVLLQAVMSNLVAL